MASGGVVKKEIGGNHDVLRFGVNDSVKGDLAPPHPLQASVHKANMKDVLIDDLSVARFQRPPGALPSSMLGYEALTGSLDDLGFEDYLNLPQDSESFRAPDMHHGMEVRLGLSKGPVCPSFN
uniref:Proteasome maturation factor UMP1 family protein n=1 Tax=Oryza rufipogon TaxID=4529 RepID=A0A0E0NM89_ORYRU